MLTAWQPPQEIPPVVVLRKMLRGPLTLGHVLLLHEMGNPIVAGKPSGPEDLVAAVIVCQSKTAEDAAADIAYMDRSFWGRWMLRRWASRWSSIAFEPEFQRFSEWFLAQVSGPVVDDADDKKPAKPLTSPWPVYLMSVAIARLGLSVAEAKATPIRTLKQWIGAHAESEGGVKFITEELQEAIDKAVKSAEAARDAALLAKKGSA